MRMFGGAGSGERLSMFRRKERSAEPLAEHGRSIDNTLAPGHGMPNGRELREVKKRAILSAKEKARQEEAKRNNVREGKTPDGEKIAPLTPEQLFTIEKGVGKRMSDIEAQLGVLQRRIPIARFELHEPGSYDNLFRLEGEWDKKIPANVASIVWHFLDIKKAEKVPGARISIERRYSPEEGKASFVLSGGEVFFECDRP